MYFFSQWFPSLSNHLYDFLNIINFNRGTEGWITHESSNGIPFRSLYHSYKTKASDLCIIESHRHTIDLQYCYSGGEIISFADASLKKSHIDYSENKDKDTWSANRSDMSSLRLIPRSFVLFEPNQLHCPQQYDGKSDFIEKIVLKLPIDFISE